jgi:hypothetical protein
MPNLFPIDTTTATSATDETTVSQAQFGKSWRFDFAAGDFMQTPTGKVAESRGVDAWLEWCQKAVLTKRYRYLVYTRNHGQEFESLISRHLNRAGNESEIKRMVAECLNVDPRTYKVENFTFTWENDQCFFTCEVTNIRGETGTINGSVVLG